MSQRPTYAGTGPKVGPGLASRFKDTNDTSTSAPIKNRFKEDGTTAKIPVDARGDGELVDRLSQWPRENRPFWLLNSEQIEAHRNPQGNSSFDTQQNIRSGENRPVDGNLADSRSSFNGAQRPSETRPIRPNQPRSSFLGALRR